MIGLALLGVGAVLMWAAFTKRGDAVLTALQINLPAAGQPAVTPSDAPADGGGTTHSAMIPGSGDSGTHQGLDASGAVVTIDKPYGAMTDAEKGAANAFANHIGNFGSAL